MSVPAERCPYEPLALELLEPFTIETREFGEKRIMELISKESEYGEEDRARFRLCRRLFGRGLFSREPAIKTTNQITVKCEVTK